MSNAERLRSQAAHARRLARWTTDVGAREALETLAGEFEGKADKIERQPDIAETTSIPRRDIL